MDFNKIFQKLSGAKLSHNKDLSKLIKKLKLYMPDNQIEIIIKSYTFGAKAHKGQKRISGEPYISHPLAVAEILSDMHMDGSAIAAAILHDVIEDTNIKISGLKKEFGKEISNLVDSVSKLDQINFTNKAEVQAETFRKMILAMIEDRRVILIKLADRLHNMRTLDAMPRKKKERIAKETLDIYAPIANRLGINRIKTELEDLGIQQLYPFRYSVINNALKKRKGGQKQIVKKISSRFAKALKEENITHKVIGREKHIYSIYKKMSEKKCSLTDLADVYGFRIIVEGVNSCYRTLGTVHNIYKPVPGRFKDYIAIPRINGYQSLHTTLFGPKGIPIEVQIRTTDMNKIAESGVAAHWQYKAQDKSLSMHHLKAGEWLANLNELQKSGNSEEFLEKVKIDLFPDKIYVFTPKGDIIPLSRGATAVDFAYAVHTDVGNRCIEAEIDRTPVPLSSILKNGETVKIITARGTKPNPAWINFVVTAKARSAIHNYMRNMRQEESIDLGKHLVDQSLKKLNSSLRKIGKLRFRRALKDLGLKKSNELFEQIGLGERLAPLTAQYLIVATDKNKNTPSISNLIISGTEGMLISYGKCCYPIPGDKVMGYHSSDRGIVIHRNNCANLRNFRKHPSKWLTVSWENNIDQAFSSHIQVKTINKMGVLAKVAAKIADLNSNIESMLITSHEEHSILSFILSVQNRYHLAQIIRKVRNMSDVIHITRDQTHHKVGENVDKTSNIQ